MNKILPNIDRRQLRQFAAARKLQRLAEDKHRNWELAQGSNSSVHPKLNRLFGHRIVQDKSLGPVNPTTGPTVINDVNAFEDYISQLMQARRESAQGAG